MATFRFHMESGKEYDLDMGDQYPDLDSMLQVISVPRHNNDRINEFMGLHDAHKRSMIMMNKVEMVCCIGSDDRKAEPRR